MEAGFYIHIPFCRKKCKYCGFFSGFYPEKNLISKYTDYLCKELKLYKDSGFLPRTIYLGGGTPSLLSTKDIEKITTFLRKNFCLDYIEFTIEANPEDITMDLAKCFIDNGINRISLGFQSMNDEVLRFLGRINNSTSNKNSYEILRKAGFENISIDFISSIFQDDATETINQVVSFNAEHYSIYSLSLDENTLLYREYKKGNFNPVKDEEYLSDYNKIRSFMINKGYLHYEISNYARNKNYISIHNKGYWDYLPYIGIGIGAVGFVYESGEDFKGIRFNNVKNFRDYFKLLDEEKFPIAYKEEIDFKTGIKEFVMLGLRKTQGFSFRKFEGIFKKNFYDCYDFEKIKRLKLYLKINSFRIALKTRFFPIMNSVISEIWGAML
ncbi:MAG: radical SAM family heme chaperone HemW [Brevinematia bacterium]